MSNLREPILSHRGFFNDPNMTDESKEKSFKRLMDDIYARAQFIDTTLEDITPSIESMKDGENKFVKVGDDVRHYQRIGTNLYYTTLTKV